VAHRAAIKVKFKCSERVKYSDHWALKGLRFEVFAATSVEIVVFRVVAP